MWRQITEEDLQQKCTSLEFGKISEVFDAGRDSVTNFVRGYVASAGVEMDSNTTTIPDRLIGAACDYLLVDLYRRLGGTLIDPKDHRKDARQDAIRLFESVAKGTYSIADPNSAAESSDNSGGAQRLTTRPPCVNRDNIGGF